VLADVKGETELQQQETNQPLSLPGNPSVAAEIVL